MAEPIIRNMLQLQLRHLTLQSGRGDRQALLVNAIRSPWEKDLWLWDAAKFSP
jgi:hypothetical protein